MSPFSLILTASVGVVFAAVTLSFFSPPYSSLHAADSMVKNARIYTSDDSLPFADSMAIRHGRILRVGNYSFVKEVVGKGTQELDAGGKVVVPGFIDSHVHFISGGLQIMRVELRGVNRKEELIKRIHEAVKNKKQGSWVLGGGWNNDFWGGDLPMASWIDDITPCNPVWLTRMDGHMGLANSVAIKMAKITKDTNDPTGGTIINSSDDEPTGLLIDSAMKLLIASIPEVSVDERKEALLRASNLALARGVTTVVDVGRYFPGASVELSWEDLSDVYRWADSAKRMKTRVCLFFPMETWSRLKGLIRVSGRKLSDWIFLGGVKAFSDGSLGSNSALFYEPYADDPHNYGLQVTDFDTLSNMTLDSDRSGLQVAIHAIGDKANDMILDLYESVISANGVRDRRPRVEHAQHLAAVSATRFGQLGVIASVQPDHLLDDADSAAKKLGIERANGGSYLFKTLLAHNAELTFGSDWPVADINPIRSIKTAMLRRPPGWEIPWIASECVTLNEALKAYTISAARACFLDNEVGSLSPGKLADFVILSANSLDDFAMNVSVYIEATYVGGVRSYP
ncbi:unnamed protein product [Rhodiola kirilowii]